MDAPNSPKKTPRARRNANFTADEKALLAQLIKQNSIVESKLTDGKSVLKKKAAWELITTKYNANIHVHKRDTVTLKRAWDNMKAATRRTRAAERGSLLQTGGGPSLPPQPPHQGAIITMVEEAAPSLIFEIKNSFDSDGVVLSQMENSHTSDFTGLDVKDITAESIELNPNNYSVSETARVDVADIPDLDDCSDNKKTEEPVRKPSDYIRREAVMRIKHFQNKKKIELQILKIQLEVEQIKKNAALMEEERQKLLLEKAKSEEK